MESDITNLWLGRYADARMITNTALVASVGNSWYLRGEYVIVLANTLVHCDRVWRSVLEAGLARHMERANKGRLVDCDIATANDETPMKIGLPYHADQLSLSSAALGAATVAVQETSLLCGSSSKRSNQVAKLLQAEDEYGLLFTIGRDIISLCGRHFSLI